MKNLPALSSRKIITVKKPLLKSIIEEDASLTIEEFIKLL